MEHSKHIVRMAVLVIVVLIGFLLSRTFFSPPSFGRYGFYRADNVKEQMAKPVRHGESVSCSDCHDEKTEDLNSGSHQSINCENCHAPLVTHIKEEENFAAMAMNRSSSLCLRCHESLDARPADFPQIRGEEHLKKASMEMTPDVCLGCHEPHTPTVGG